MKKDDILKLYIWKGEHDNSYVIVRNRDEEDQMFLDEMSNMYSHKDFEWMNYKHQKNQLKYTKEEINALPDSMHEEKQKMLEKLNDWLQEAENSKRDKKIYELIKKCISEEDAKLAKRIMIELCQGINFEVHYPTEYQSI